MMDSVEIVIPLPASAVPDLITSAPNSREGLDTAVGTTSPYPETPAILSSNPEAAHAVVIETPASLQIQGEADQVDDGGKGREPVDENAGVKVLNESSTLAGRPSSDAVAVVQQVKEAGLIEIDIPVDVGSKSEEQIIVGTEGETDQALRLIEPVDGASNADGISVEVVLEEAKPDVGQEGSLQGEDGSSGTLLVEVVGIRIVEVSTTSVDDGGGQLSDQTGNPVVVETVSTTVISLADEQGVAGDGGERKEDDFSAIPVLEQEEVEVVTAPAAPGDVIGIIGEGIEEGVSIIEPLVMNNLESEMTNAMVEDVLQTGSGDSSIGIRATEEVVIPAALSEEALINRADNSTTDAMEEKNATVVELESLEAVKTMDDGVDNIPAISQAVVAEEASHASDPSLTQVGAVFADETPLAVELAPSVFPKVDGLVDAALLHPSLSTEQINAGLLSTSDNAMEVSAQERTIVVQLDASVVVSEEPKVEGLADPPELGDALNAIEPLTSTEIDISADDRSIAASRTLIPSEDLDAAFLPGDVKEEKPGDEGAIPAGNEAFGGNMPSVEPVAFVVDDSSGLSTPDIRDMSAEEPRVVVEQSTTSTSAAIPAGNEAFGGNMPSVEPVAFVVDDSSGLSTPDIRDMSAEEPRVVVEQSTTSTSAAIPAGNEAFGGNMPSVEPVAFVVDDSSGLSTPDIRDMSAEEPRVVAEQSTTSTSAAIPAGNEAFGGNMPSVEPVAFVVDDSSGLSTPDIRDMSAEEPRVVVDQSTTSTSAAIPPLYETKEADLTYTVVGGEEEDFPVVENLTDVRGVSDSSTAIPVEKREELKIAEEIIVDEKCAVTSNTTDGQSPRGKKTQVEKIQNEIKLPADAEISTETAVQEETPVETVIQMPTGKIEDVEMEIMDRREEEAVQEIPKVTEVVVVIQEETAHNPTTGVEILVVEKDEGRVAERDETLGVEEGETLVVDKDEISIIEKDIEMENTSEETAGEPVIITESLVQEEGATTDDIINPEVDLPAIEQRIDTTTVLIMTADGNAVGSAVDVDRHGVLIGVGSSVEKSGLTITEVAGTTVILEEFLAEKQSWGLSEPLITPPAEEILEAINELSTAENVVEDKKPQMAEGLVVVTEDNADTESNVLAGGIIAEITQNQPPSQSVALDDVTTLEMDLEKKPFNAVVESGAAGEVDQGETQEPQPVILADTDTDLAATALGIAAFAKLKSPLEDKEAVVDDIGPKSMAPIAEIPVLIEQQGMPTIPDVEKVSTGPAFGAKECGPIEDDPVVSEEVDVIEQLHSEALTDPTTVSTSAAESNAVSIAVEIPQKPQLPPIQESTVETVEHVTRKTTLDGADKVEESAEIVSSSANGLGLNLVEATDISVLKDRDGILANAIVGAEASVAAVGLEIDRGSKESRVGSTLDGSNDTLDSSLREALEKNEKKRGREDEQDPVAEDNEKTWKSAKTSNGEISITNDAAVLDVKIEEDVKVDKKRTRADSEALAAEADGLLQTKAQKTGAQSRKVDAEGLDMEVVEEDVEEDVEENTPNGVGHDSSTARRYKKRKIALFLGYSGAGYQGMQKNPGAITIEGELEEALFRAGAIAESNYGDPKKLDWRRAARTDKGVSAVGQVVSGSFFIDPPGFIERLNSHLPKQIRVYGYKRATASFNAKKLCDRRRYEYVLPVYAFDPTVHLDREGARAQAAAVQVESIVKEEVIKPTTTEISGPPDEGEGGKVTRANPTSSPAVGAVDGMVSSVKDVSTTVTTEVEEIFIKEDDQNLCNGLRTIQEEVTVVTEVTIKSEPSTDLQATQEPKDKPSELGSAAAETPVGILLETPEVLAEQKKVTLEKTVTETFAETVVDIDPRETKQALEEKVKRSSFKFGEGETRKLNRILGAFEGHHNFHNFTARTKATDPSANRYIISFEAENVFSAEGMEFVRCTVVGQSFMLHQIRKMIGLAVAIMRGFAPESILATALRRDTKVNVPMAPELGLFLEECYYSSYNKKFKATHEEMSLCSFKTEVDEFKREFIYPHIVSTEARDSTFAMWLHSLNDRHYPDFVAARERENSLTSQ